MPKGKPWTREEERQLRELRSQGCKVSEIAVVMGKSEEAVMKKLQRIGLKVVQQREGRRAGRAAVQQAGVVLDAAGEADLAQHLDVVARALLDALRLQVLLLRLEEGDALFQLLLDLANGAL